MKETALDSMGSSCDERSCESVGKLPLPAASDALLVGHRNALRTEGGGVQACTREYMTALEAAGYRLRPVSFEFRSSLRARVLRRLLPTTSNVPAPAGLLRTIRSTLHQGDVAVIFFALNLFAEVSRELRREFPKVRQVLLSYGVESLDSMLAEELARRTNSAGHFRAAAEWKLGRQLLEEAAQRRWMDAVLTLSPLEVEVEKWLGASRVLWVPRLVLEPPLTSKAVAGRVGCVSTLDHPPNLDGLLRLFDALERRALNGLRFRLVGQPESGGRALAARYAFIDYLGPLSDGELRDEASTWCCFVHPLFVYAKGCSTKLATALGWGLPIATTRSGARGYASVEGALPLANSPDELAELVVARSATDAFETGASQTAAAGAAAPSIAAVGAMVREFLL